MFQSAPPTNYGPPTGVGTSGEIVTALLSVGILFMVLFTVELLYVTTTDARNRFQTLLDYTASAEDMSIVIHQMLKRIIITT
jgi:hypothetical protein